MKNKDKGVFSSTKPLERKIAMMKQNKNTVCTQDCANFNSG